MNSNKPLSSQRTGHHNGGGGGGGRPHVTRNGSFQKRRYGGGADSNSNTRSGFNTTNTRDREWTDRRDHRGGGTNQGGINQRSIHQGGGSGGGDGRGGFGRRDTGGRGGDRGGGGGASRDRMMDARGGPQPQQHPPQERGRDFGRGQHAPQPRGPPTPEDIERAKIPIPPHERRTLVLTNVPSQLKFYHVQHHFLNNFSAYVQYALMDREAGDTYIRFKHVADAKRVWQKGSEGLDGSPPQQTGGKADIGSWVALGIKLKAVHFTNFMVDSKYMVDQRSVDRDPRNHDRDQRGMDRDQGNMDRDQRDMDRNQRSMNQGASNHTNNSSRMCGTGGGGRGQGGGGAENHHRKRNWSEDRGNGYSQHQRAQHSQRVQHSHPPPPPPPPSKNNLRSPSKMPRYSAPEQRNYAQAHSEKNAHGNYSGQYYSQSRKQSFDHTAKAEPPHHAKNPPPNSRTGNYTNKDHYYNPPQQQHRAKNPPPNNHTGNYSNTDHYTDHYYDQPQRQQPYYNTPKPSASTALAPAHSPPSTNPSNNSYHRSPTKPSSGPPKHTAQHQPQYTEEEQQQWEASQQQEAAWRARCQAEYDQFLARKNARLSHISTLEQKRDLLVQQEGMLTKQLPLHKKMLAVLQAKKAPAAEQSKKMKEILSAQTRIMELKKEMKHLVEEIEKERGAAEAVFHSSERWPGGNEGADGDGGGVGVNRSIDRRTTILKVEGLYHEVAEDAIKEHFSMFGTVSSVKLVMPNELLESANYQPASSFALVNFVNRTDAERAMTTDVKFEDSTLTCTWHNPTLFSSETDRNEGDSKSIDHSAAADDVNGDDDLYDGVGGTNYDCSEFEEEKATAPPESEKVYGYNEEEDYLVDYD